MRNRAIVIRLLHKWLGLLVGLQVFIWLGSGLYMVLLDIDFIHGDSLVKNMQQTVAIPQNSDIDMAGLRARYTNATTIGLTPVMGETLYTVTTPDERLLIDQNGKVISPLDEKTASEIARFHFNADAGIRKTSLITSNPPMEIQTRRLPLWRIDFNDGYNTSFYVDPFTGTLITTRRFQYWRIFDFMWMLHIMDYQERTDAHNLLLKSVQATGLLFCISGLWLLFYSFSGARIKGAGKG